jgi:YD repeat-containing protein
MSAAGTAPRGSAARRRGARARLALACALACAAALTTPALAAETARNLPTGPGSRGGLSDGLVRLPNRGELAWDVAVEVPQGFPGLTPDLTLRYRSGNGNGLLGVGWSLEVPAIERLTSRGVPFYDLDDDFRFGDAELVYVSGTNPRLYRARYEREFARYEWFDAGTGADGYWRVSFADGRVGYYGAAPDGTGVASARVDGPAGTFRYLPTELHDVWGHRLELHHERQGATTVLARAAWAHLGDEPGYEVHLSYEARGDVLADARPGFALSMDRRLSLVRVTSRGETIGRHVLVYDDEGGLSRLVEIRREGAEGVAHPVQYRLDYGDPTPAPVLLDAGTVDVDFGVGSAVFVDLNGDAMPDLVDGDGNGAHRVFLAVASASGDHGFAAAVRSAVPDAAQTDLSAPGVALLDSDGDGLIDVVDLANERRLLNGGSGDWSRAEPLPGLPAALLNGGQASLRSLSAVDLDNDRLVDLAWSAGRGGANETRIFLNDGDAGFRTQAVAPLGVDLADEGVLFADVNGDSLPDIVTIEASAARYRLNLGRGEFSEFRTLAGFAGSDDEGATTQVADLNGDGLADIVAVERSAIRLWMNLGGDRIEALPPLRAPDLGGALPSLASTARLGFQDLNGNGSTDVVWLGVDGAVRFADLFPARPNLLRVVDDGLGLRTTITYRASVEEMVADGGADSWSHRLPFPHTVVTTVEVEDLASGTRSARRFAYHQGVYDGEEGQFRGYAEIDEASERDGAVIATLVRGYTVGLADSYDFGRPSWEERWSDGALLTRADWTYDECVVSGLLEGLERPVRFLCLRAVERELREGRPAAEWTVEREEWRYDGQGNPVLHADLGVVRVGGRDAAAGCESCAGDEWYVATDYAYPDASTPWILGLPQRITEYAEPGGRAVETEVFYDGEPFVGMPAGQLFYGAVTRVARRPDAAAAPIDVLRVRTNSHGRVVTALGPLAEVGGDAYRREYRYDERGLDVLSEERFLEGARGPYRLRREWTYEPRFGRVASESAWTVASDVVSDGAAGPAPVTRYAWDALGRLAAVAYPGDTLLSPSVAVSYEVTPAGVAERYLAEHAGGALEHVVCRDGAGRAYQSRRRLPDGRYRLSGYDVHDAQGRLVRQYPPAFGADAACPAGPPAGSPAMALEHDALGRPAARVRLRGGVAVYEEWRYAPGTVAHYDWTDLDLEGPFAGTPTVRTYDGLGRLRSVSRSAPGEAPLSYEVSWSDVGTLAQIVDPAGNLWSQTTDAMGRVLRREDPDRGVLVYTYDGAGNPIRESNGAGALVEREFDGLGRVVAEWVRGAEASTRVTWEYDLSETCPDARCTTAAGRLVRVTAPGVDGPVTDWFGYDERQRQIWRGRDVGGALLEDEVALDLFGEPEWRSLPGGRALSLERDAAGDLAAIEDLVAVAARDAAGRAVELQLGAGLRQTRAWDDAGRLVRLDLEQRGRSLLAYDWIWDPSDNLLVVSDGAPPSGGPSGAASFAYDPHHRLRSAVFAPEARRSEEVVYAYDGAENLVRRDSSAGIDSPIHDGERLLDEALAHGVSAAGDDELLFDGAGRTLAAGARTFDWNEAGRLAVVNEGDRVLATYAFGADGAILEARSADGTRHAIGDSVLIEDGVASAYLRVDGEPVARLEYADTAATLLGDLAPAERDGAVLSPRPDGVVTAGDAWLALAADAGYARVRRRAEAADVDTLLRSSARQVLVDRQERPTFLHRGATGQTVAVSDPSGALVERTHRYPSGAVRWTSAAERDPADASGWRDDATGLVLRSSGVLDPTLGLFLAPYPLGLLEAGPEELERPWLLANPYRVGLGAPRADLACGTCGFRSPVAGPEPPLVLDPSPGADLRGWHGL